MFRLNCLIVDDEPVARKVIREFAEQVPFLQVLAQCENVRTLEAALAKDRVDLVFLDIEIPRRTGLDYLRDTTDRPLVIVTTAYPSHALEGYELDVTDYLVKPIAFSRFLKACCKARDLAEQKNAPQAAAADDSLFVRCEKKIERLLPGEVIYAESLGNYVTIHTVDRKIVAYLTMKSLESQLPRNRFLKIHQSYIVATSRIESIDGNQVRIGGVSLPVSRNYREAVTRWLDQRMLRR